MILTRRRVGGESVSIRKREGLPVALANQLLSVIPLRRGDPLESPDRQVDLLPLTPRRSDFTSFPDGNRP